MNASRTTSPLTPFELLALCAIGVLACSAVTLATPTVPYNDFDQFYAAGQLVGSGQLYDFDRLRQLEAPFTPEPGPFGRIPVFAEAFKILTFLPRRAAEVVWFTVNLFAIAGFIRLWPFPKRAHAALAFCWSIPAAVAQLLGQDTPLFLFWIALGFWLMRRRLDLAAGLVFGLAASKFHLAIALPVLLIATRRWRVLLGGMFGCATLLGLSFLIEGPEWPVQFLVLMRTPSFTPAPHKMPNLHGLLSLFPFRTVLEALLTGLVLVAVYLLARRAVPGVGEAAMLAAGLLCSFHAYIYDGVLLLPLALIAFDRGPLVLKVLAVLASSPLAFLALTMEPYEVTKPYVVIAQFVIVGFALTALASSLIRVRQEASCGRLQSATGSVPA